ncbi:MAG: hypothetical protein QM758_14030 [Armatimonas sp.]
MDEYLTGEEALARFGTTKTHLKQLRNARRAVRSGLLSWRYPKREILRLMLIGYTGGETEESSVPIVRLVNAIFVQAIDAEEERICFEPQENRGLNVYFGSGRTPRFPDSYDPVTPLPSHLTIAITGRLKDMADMALDIRDRPQYGLIRLMHNRANWNCPATVEPTHFGERISIELRLAPNAVSE